MLHLLVMTYWLLDKVNQFNRLIKQLEAVSGIKFTQTISRAPAKTILDYADKNNLRQNFNALALFSPTVRTDGSGRAVVDVKLPDNLTRYRITAVSVDTGKRFGKTESTITAKQPLMVRPSAPRFMNFGDKIEMPVVVQNQTDAPLAVEEVVSESVSACLAMSAVALATCPRLSEAWATTRSASSMVAVASCTLPVRR